MMKIKKLFLLSLLLLSSCKGGTSSSFNEVYENYTRRIPTNVLNDVLLDATLIQQAPFFNGDRLKIYYASQVDKNPPSFVLFVNDPNYLHFSYQRYLENKLREAFNFEGTPIKFILRKKEE